MNRTVLLATLAIAAVLLAFLLLRPTPEPSGDFNLNDLPRLGAETAPVTLVIVEDFKCPVCKLFEEQVTPDLETRYVNTGKAKVYSLIFPFLGKKFALNPDDSILAAQAAKCVLDVGGHDSFEMFKSILFRAQGDESKIWATRERLHELAQNVEGMNQEKFQRCLSTDATQERVNADVEQANAAKVNGTPSVFVNGKLIEAPTIAEIKDRVFKAIDAAQP